MKPAAQHKPHHQITTATVMLGLILPALAAILSGFMEARHLWALNLPGCGQGGGCEWATNGPFSSLWGISVAGLGLAYFVAVAASWLVTAKHGIWKPLLAATRVGALASIGFSVLMFSTDHVCPYCLAIHAANLAWWLFLESRSRGARPYSGYSTTPTAVGLILFIAILIGVKWQEKNQLMSAIEEQSKLSTESIEKIGTSEPAIVDTPLATTPQTAPAGTSVPTSNPRRFGGRFWTGDPNAPVRIVIFQDYQCQLCRQAESTLAEILNRRSDVVLSVKQFPFDKTCNRLILNENIHPGSCQSARLAEAVGLVGGKVPYWAFHTWLFDHAGKVTDAELADKLTSLGIDRKKLDAAIAGGKPDSIISADIEEGVKVGLTFTPMIFVNGYEIRGWQTAGAIPAAIEKAAQMAQAQPRPNDLPVPALERQFGEWLNSPQFTMVLRKDDHIRGLISAPTAVVIYGDMSEPYNAAGLDVFNRVMTDTTKMVLIYRTFPLQADCNDMVKRPINPRACEIARLMEAASIAGGENAFRALQNWIVARLDSLPPPETLVDAAARGCNLPPAALKAALNDPQIDARIGQNIEAAKQLGVDASPTVFVNGHRLKDWRMPGLLEKVIEATSQPAPPVYRRP
ncbi:MAG: thioredoxin domain-containing protein [Candidatus Zixiibacteriota bacterium]